eukprot:856549-Rhodomonas_salina.2
MVCNGTSRVLTFGTLEGVRGVFWTFARSRSWVDVSETAFALASAAWKLIDSSLIDSSALRGVVIHGDTWPLLCSSGSPGDSGPSD